MFYRPKQRVVWGAFTIVWTRGRRFEPFVSTKPGGTGIDLGICRTIVETRGGEIVFLTEVGKGATFRVTVPMFEKTVD